MAGAALFRVEFPSSRLQCSGLTASPELTDSAAILALQVAEWTHP